VFQRVLQVRNAPGARDPLPMKTGTAESGEAPTT
jgi:CDP-diacylglycerol--glycerol-3-phosphate 3-phosphatidyltransferase